MPGPGPLGRVPGASGMGRHLANAALTLSVAAVGATLLFTQVIDGDQHAGGGGRHRRLRRRCSAPWSGSRGGPTRRSPGASTS